MDGDRRLCAYKDVLAEEAANTRRDPREGLVSQVGIQYYMLTQVITFFAHIVYERNEVISQQISVS